MADFEMSQLDVVVADDKDMFIDISTAALLRAGCLEENIFSAEDGVEALEKLDGLQEGGHDDAPILLVLDVRMPRMGGNQAAAEVHKRHVEGNLRRRPFMVSLSAGHTETIEAQGGDHNMMVPKPLQGDSLTRVLNSLSQWWAQGNGRPSGTAAPSAGAGRGGAFDISKVDVVLGDDEAVSRMVLQMLFQKAGVATDIREADEDAALVDEIRELQDGDASNPIIVVLGVSSWVDAVIAENFSTRRPFVVCGSVAASGASQATKSKFDTIMTCTANSDDVAKCLQDCEAWWTR